MQRRTCSFFVLKEVIERRLRCSLATTETKQIVITSSSSSSSSSSTCSLSTTENTIKEA
jgi:hypothetical protein